MGMKAWPPRLLSREVIDDSVELTMRGAIAMTAWGLGGLRQSLPA